MIVIRVLVTVKAEEKKAFVTHLSQEAVEVQQQFAGCEKFNLYEDTVKENSFLIYEEWQSQANFNDYKNSDFFKQNGAVLFPMMADSPDSAYFQAEVLQ